ncbi:MAG: hypothetical protein H7Y20_02810, partial [Bryobacteraceae bacterium]|nr:hypothetical protein [Bryobacteraceae bacterium]
NASTQRYDLPLVKEDLYVAGRRVAPSDRLGSDLSGGVKLLPYGEELQPPNVANDRTKFATYHRDGNGLDYADQRYYSPGTGRFLTSDPYQSPKAVGSPSGWNRFAYVTGDPVNKTDRRGLDEENPTFCDIYGEEWYCNSFPTHSDEFDQTRPEPGRRDGDRSDMSDDDWQLYSAKSRLGRASGKAFDALNDSDCLKAIGGTGNLDPRAVLADILKNGKYGEIVFEKLPEDRRATATTTTPGGLERLFFGNRVKITINMTPSTDFSRWNTEGLQGNTETLLHELAHAMNYIAGARNGFQEPDNTAAAQAFNKSYLEDHCLKKIFR